MTRRSFLSSNEAAILRRVRARVGRSGLRVSGWRLVEAHRRRKVFTFYAVGRSAAHGGRSFYVDGEVSKEMLRDGSRDAVVDLLAATLAQAAITFLRDDRA